MIAFCIALATLNHGILCPVCVKINLSAFYDRFLPVDGCQDNKNAKTDVPAQSINTDNLDNISPESLEAALNCNATPR